MMMEEFTGPRTTAAIAAGTQVNNVIVEHAVFRQILDGCLDLIDTMTRIRMPSGILIQSEPGMGKTLLLNMIKREIARRDADESKSRCLQIMLDSTVNETNVAMSMMHALGYPMLPSSPSRSNMNAVIETGLKRVQPKAFLVDEMQQICEGKREITAKRVTDWFKLRMDEFNIPLIGVGTHGIERLAKINDQFTSRASSNFVMNAFEYGDSWRQLLSAFAGAVHLVNLEILRGPIAKPLHAATNGNMRSLKRILIYACMHATGRSDPRASADDFAKAYDNAFGMMANRSNPLRMHAERGV